MSIQMFNIHHNLRKILNCTFSRYMTFLTFSFINILSLSSLYPIAQTPTWLYSSRYPLPARRIFHGPHTHKGSKCPNVFRNFPSFHFPILSSAFFFIHAFKFIFLFNIINLDKNLGELKQNKNKHHLFRST